MGSPGKDRLKLNPRSKIAGEGVGRVYLTEFIGGLSPTPLSTNSSAASWPLKISRICTAYPAYQLRNSQPCVKVAGEGVGRVYLTEFIGGPSPTPLNEF